VVTAVINHRISLASSVEELQQQITKVLKPVAEKYNLALESFGSDVELEECPMLTGGTKAGKVIVAEAYNSSYVI
jgi:Gly-Xaa carboxypeptidase